MGKGAWLQRLGFVRPRPIGVAEFRGLVVEEIRRRKPEAEVRLVGDDEYEVVGGNWGQVERLHAHYREHPRDLESLVKQAADTALYDPEPAKPEELIVLVRPDSFNPGANGLSHHLPGGLVALVALDRPERYVFSPGDDLQNELGMGPPEIWARAMDNLRRRLSMSPPVHRDGYAMGVKTNIGLASSLLVLDDYWNQIVFTSRGHWVVAPLERDELVLAPLMDAMAVRALCNIVARCESSELLSDILLLRCGGGWELFD